MILLEWLLAFLIILLSVRCIERQHYVYRLWDYYWKLLEPKSMLCLIEPDVVESFSKGADGKELSKEEFEKSIKDALQKIKEQPGSRQRSNVALRLWRAIKEEVGPAIRHLREINKEPGRPGLIELDARIVKKFSNDKEINDRLRKIRGKEKKENGEKKEDEKKGE